MPALPLRRIIATGSPVPPWPWSTHAPIGWCPNPRLKVAAASSFSECAVIRVASRSTISGAFTVIGVVGCIGPGQAPRPRPHRGPGGVDRRQRAGASRRPACRSAGTPSDRRRPCPNTAGSDRTWAISARQSPPIATEIAKSSNTFPGSCTASGRIHGRNAADNSRSRPTLPAVAASSTAPACETTRFAVVSTISDG